MSRPPAPRGTAGKISLTRRGQRWEASCRLLLHDGTRRVMSRTAPDPDTATAKLHAAVTETLTPPPTTEETLPPKLTPTSTLHDAAQAWLDHLDATHTQRSARTGTLYRNWAAKAIETAGNVPLRKFTTGACERLIDQAATTLTPSHARNLRRVLSLIFTYAARHDAMPTNPIRDTSRPRDADPLTSALTPAGVQQLHAALAAWRPPGRGGPRPDAQLLGDIWDVMLGTSLRPSEVLAIRRCDLGIVDGRFTVAVTGKIVAERGTGAVRDNHPKHRRQTRIVSTPAFTEHALRRRLAQTPPEHDALLFATSTGKPRSVSNLQRLMRNFRDDHLDLIEHDLGIPRDEFTNKLFRRTAATAIDATGGLELAAQLLGHADPRTTRRHYAVRPESVNPATATLLEAWITDAQ